MLPDSTLRTVAYDLASYKNTDPEDELRVLRAANGDWAKNLDTPATR